MEFEAEELSGHMRCGYYWIYEENGEYELHYQKTLSVDGWVQLDTFGTFTDAVEAAESHEGGGQ